MATKKNNAPTKKMIPIITPLLLTGGFLVLFPQGRLAFFKEAINGLTKKEPTLQK